MCGTSRPASTRGGSPSGCGRRGARRGALAQRLQLARATGTAQRVQRVTAARARLSALSPRAVLARGYSLVTLDDGTLVRQARQLAPGRARDTGVRGGTRRRARRVGDARGARDGIAHGGLTMAKGKKAGAGKPGGAGEVRDAAAAAPPLGPDGKPYTFEKALARLEEIVDELEDGKLALEASIGRFEEGVGVDALPGERVRRAPRAASRSWSRARAARPRARGRGTMRSTTTRTRMPMATTTRSSPKRAATHAKPAPRAALPPPFEADRRAVDDYLARRLARLPGAPPRLAQAIRHAALAPGKRVRPLLVLLGYDAVGGAAKARTAMLPAAAALEFVHAFSLVHDDLPALDDDDLRRGRPTLHKQFDEATAILAGDALLALAFEELAATSLVGERPAARRHGRVRGGRGGRTRGDDRRAGARPRGRGPVGAGGGAARAHEGGRHRDSCRQDGRLLAAALVVGGCLGGGDARQLGTLEAIGLDLGLAFQVADDLLNEKGDARTLGKNAGTDRARGKATYPRAVGASKAARALSTLTARAVRRAEVFPRIAGRFATLAALLAARQA